MIGIGKGVEERERAERSQACPSLKWQRREGALAIWLRGLLKSRRADELTHAPDRDPEFANGQGFSQPRRKGAFDAGAIASASPNRQPAARIDLENGLFYRRAIGRRANKTKAQLPAPIPDRLLAYLRRWHRLGIASDYFVEWNGKPIKSVKTGFKSALKLAGLADEDLSPHSLRHTAVTWALQGGATTFQAAGLVGMSEDMVRRVYGHHSPAFMREAAEAIQNNRGRLGRREPVKALPLPLTR
jgi:hypothetical protein